LFDLHCAKDGEAITGAWDRFRVSTKKLRIKGVLPEDGGLIVCKAVNGFGSKELATRLLVVGKHFEISAFLLHWTLNLQFPG
jgi:hypothetical protein